MFLAQYQTQGRCLASDIFAGRLEDRQIHYGLVFEVGAERDSADFRHCSDLDTHSRHGQVQDWWLGRPFASLPGRQQVLLIPRSWLIQQGYLPWWVIFARYHRFPMRHADHLREHIWLEDTGMSNALNATPQLRAA